MELDPHFAGLQSRHVQQVVDIEAQLIAALFGDAQILQLGFVQRTGETINDNGNKLAGRGERCLQFV